MVRSLPESAATIASPRLPDLPEDAQRAIVAAGLDPRDRRYLFTVPVGEAALRTGLSEPSIYNAIAKGELPSIKLGRRRSIPRPAFETWLSGAASPGARVRPVGT